MPRKLKSAIDSKSVLFILCFIMGTSLCRLYNITNCVFFSFRDSLFSFSQSVNNANSIFMFVLQSLPFLLSKLTYELNGQFLDRCFS